MYDWSALHLSLFLSLAVYVLAFGAPSNPFSSRIDTEIFYALVTKRVCLSPSNVCTIVVVVVAGAADAAVATMHSHTHTTLGSIQFIE